MKCGECTARIEVKGYTQRVCKFNPFLDKGKTNDRAVNQECDLTPERIEMELNRARQKHTEATRQQQSARADIDTLVELQKEVKLSA